MHRPKRYLFIATLAGTLLIFTGASSSEPSASQSAAKLKHPLRPSAGEKIIGGVEATPFEFPWLAALFDVPVTDGSLPDFLDQFCAGTLIDPEWILTAAHCVTDNNGVPDDPSTLSVGLGKHRLDVTNEPGSEYINIDWLIIHPNFNPHTVDSDIALLHLAQPSKITPVPVVEQGDPNNLASEGTMTTVWESS